MNYSLLLYAALNRPTTTMHTHLILDAFIAQLHHILIYIYTDFSFITLFSVSRLVRHCQCGGLWEDDDGDDDGFPADASKENLQLDEHKPFFILLRIFSSWWYFCYIFVCFTAHCLSLSISVGLPNSGLTFTTFLLSLVLVLT